MICNNLVRPFIHRTIKTFPWSYPEQERTLLRLIDGILAFRSSSLSAIDRWSFDDITVKKLTYLVNNGLSYLKEFNDYLNRCFSKFDRRRVHLISVDDTPIERFGEKVFAASTFKDHTNNGYKYGNVLVNCCVTSNITIKTSYLTYIPRKYLEKTGIDLRYLETKIELAQTHIIDEILNLLDQRIPIHKIWITTDSWYISEHLLAIPNHWNCNYLVGIKKNANCNLFGKNHKLENLFKSDDNWRLIRDKETGNTLYYKRKILNLDKYGRSTVFAIKRGNEKRVRYYTTKNLKMTIQTFIKRWRKHWMIERFHHYTKQYFGLEECYSGKEIPNKFYWQLSHVLYKLFVIVQEKLKASGKYITLAKLWEIYCLDYELERSHKLSRSKKNQETLKRKVVAF